MSSWDFFDGSVVKIAAAAAKPLQSSLTLCDPIDGSPPGPSVHGIFQARVLEWGAIAFSGLRLHAPNARGPGSIPGQGTRSHMLQLRPSTANKYIINKNMSSI